MTVDERAVHKIVNQYEMAVYEIPVDEMSISLDVMKCCNTKL